jgi:hypothetical protein
MSFPIEWFDVDIVCSLKLIDRGRSTCDKHPDQLDIGGIPNHTRKLSSVMERRKRD